jgi:hypothetical protein
VAQGNNNQSLIHATRKERMDSTETPLERSALAEYKALRNEILKRLEWYIQIYSFYVGGYFIFLAAVVYSSHVDWIQLVPVFALSVYWRLLWDQQFLVALSTYIAAMLREAGLSGPGNAQKEPIGHMRWETGEFYPRIRPYYKYSVIGIFVVCSVLPSIAFSAYTIVADGYKCGLPVISLLPPRISTIVAAVSLAINVPIGVYIWKKTVSEHF